MSIFRKSLVTLGLAALLLSVALAISVLAFMNSLYYETNARALRNTAAALFGVFGEERLAALFAPVPPEGDLPLGAIGSVYRLTLIDRAGEVLRDSRVEGELVNHLDREEVQAALAGREGSARRHSVSTGMRQLYAALPVHAADGGVAGVFRLSVDIPDFWRRIAGAALPSALPFLLFYLLLVCAALAVIVAFSGSLSASLSRLVGIADAAPGESGRGENRRMTSLSGEAGEFLVLEKALRGMAAELKGRIERARAEGRRLEAILNGMAEAVFAMDNSLTLHLVNPRAKTLFNVDGADTRKLSLLEATRSTELEEAARMVLSTGRPLEMELKLRPGGGGEQRFQVFAAPLASVTHNAPPEGVVIVMEDVTRLIRLEQVRKDFVANVSHELRTPIQLIKGFSETLLDSSLDNADQIRHCVAIIHKNAGTMENLTNDLLILASLEDGSPNDAHAGMETRLLAPLFAEAASAVAPQADQKQIAVTVDCPADLAAAVNGSLITQALINLLDNAIKYSADQSRVWAGAFRADGNIVLEVRDEGIGIPAEHLGRIFERFYRVDRSRSPAGSAAGTGLGLSIVRHIALLHGGTAEVESRAGEGSVFRIRLLR